MKPRGLVLPQRFAVSLHLKGQAAERHTVLFSLWPEVDDTKPVAVHLTPTSGEVDVTETPPVLWAGVPEAATLAGRPLALLGPRGQRPRWRPSPPFEGRLCEVNGDDVMGGEPGEIADSPFLRLRLLAGGDHEPLGHQVLLSEAALEVATPELAAEASEDDTPPPKPIHGSGRAISVRRHPLEPDCATRVGLVVAVQEPSEEHPLTHGNLVLALRLARSGSLGARLRWSLMPVRESDYREPASLLGRIDPLTIALFALRQRRLDTLGAGIWAPAVLLCPQRSPRRRAGAQPRVAIAVEDTRGEREVGLWHPLWSGTNLNLELKVSQNGHTASA